MPTDFPFHDEQEGPEIREKLNEMWATWLAALETAVGKDGWSPLLRTVQDGERQVIELYDWIGGTGAKPSQLGYFAAAGLTSDIASAVNFRGARGLQGVKGDEGDEGPAGPANELQIGTVESGPVPSATITGTSPSQTLNLVLQKGDPGSDGTDGTAATIGIGTVATGAPGTDVIVDNVGTPTAAILDITIPRGNPGTGSGDVEGPDGVDDLQLVQFDGPTGKAIRAMDLTGILAVEGGRPYVAQPGTDYVIPAGTVAKADQLTTAVQINGTPFDGTQNITVRPVSLDIPSNSDLNTFTTIGTYDCKASGIALTILNRPSGVNIAFGMEVRPTGGVSAESKRVEQIVKAYSATKNMPSLVRSGDNSVAGAGAPAVWSPWVVRYDADNPMPLKTVNGESLLGTGNLQIDSGAGIDKIAYSDRASLRTLEGEYALVDALGLFEFEEGSVLADDDESCFATATGRWILRCPSFDLIEAWNLPQRSMLPARFVFGRAFCPFTSVLATTTVSFSALIGQAEPTDSILITPPGIVSSGALTFYAYCVDAGTVRVAITNPTGAPVVIDPAAQGYWQVLVIKAD